MTYRIVLEKENFKFSSAHFTIFGADHAERLHGHNYYVVVDLILGDVDPELSLAFDFNLVKPLVRELTESLDEYVLLPTRSPHLTVEVDPLSVHVQIGEKNYVFPAEDVKLLPIANVTSELLASYIASALKDRLRAVPATASSIDSIRVGVQETRGQTVFAETGLHDGE